eukprot:505116_1
MANSKQRTKQIVVMAVMLIVYLIGISVIYDIHLAAKVDNNIKFGQSSLGTIQQIQSQTCTHMKPYYIKSGSSYLFSHSYLIIECGKEQYVLDSLPTYFRLTLLDGSIKDTHISKHIEWHNVKNSILMTGDEVTIKDIYEYVMWSYKSPWAVGNQNCEDFVIDMIQHYTLSNEYKTMISERTVVSVSWSIFMLTSG